MILVAKPPPRIKVNRIIMLTLMGPIFGWFLLSSFLLNVSTHENDNQKDIKQLFYKPLV